MADQPIVLVTGSSGLIGRGICHRLGSNGRQVVGLDREGPPYPPPKTDCIFADMTSDESMQSAMFMIEERYGKVIDAVVHLAAYYSFSHTSSEMYHKLTYEGTQRLFRQLQRFQVRQFIFSSTMLVHAPARPGEKITENSPLRATWAYPESKIKTENLIHEIHGTIPSVIMRIAGVYTDLCQSIPLAHQISRIYQRQLTSHFYPGDLNAAQSFVHLDDLIDAVMLTIEKRNDLPDYCTFVIGEPDALSYGALQHEIGSTIYGEDWETHNISKTVAKAGAWLQEVVPGKEHPFIKPWMIDRASDYYVLDISKANTVLGWAPTRTLKETLPKMLEGLKEDPVRWYQINKLDLPPELQQMAEREQKHKAA